MDIFWNHTITMDFQFKVIRRINKVKTNLEIKLCSRIFFTLLIQQMYFELCLVHKFSGRPDVYLS